MNLSYIIGTNDKKLFQFRYGILESFIDLPYIPIKM